MNSPPYRTRGHLVQEVPAERVHRRACTIQEVAGLRVVSDLQLYIRADIKRTRQALYVAGGTVDAIV